MFRKCEVLSSTLQHTQTKARHSRTCNPELGRRDRRVSKAYWSTHLAKLVGSRFSERAFLNLRWRLIEEVTR